MSWIEIVDSAVKIGLGAFISALASYLILNKNHKHEIEMALREIKNNNTEERKSYFSQFLTHSLMLTQKYRDVSCNAQGEDYIDYLNIYNHLQIISNDNIRLGAFNLFNAVNQFIVISKNQQDRQLLRDMRSRIDANTGEFQYIAREDVKGA